MSSGPSVHGFMKGGIDPWAVSPIMIPFATRIARYTRNPRVLNTGNPLIKKSMGWGLLSSKRAYCSRRDSVCRFTEGWRLAYHRQSRNKAFIKHGNLYNKTKSTSTITKTKCPPSLSKQTHRHHKHLSPNWPLKSQPWKDIYIKQSRSAGSSDLSTHQRTTQQDLPASA
ncbi:hypothetical protein BO99DRAFT_119220 [Aspergillus violaceofuscus CBS 115571]|uniref:Uncharacterized protein n=1 Tax=Aspergillus violaceofuscus (strain CBS 115571) TaxID=1450538 RepID=A0A2V5H7C2_ASPV1|nr:hypothetical protein BO99DRAFT_119220 [Aspergillus violaceofuscus CBS 115571]